MRVTYSQVILVACMSLIIASCSSSDDGISCGGNATDSGNAGNGQSGSTVTAAGAGGDTAGAVSDGVDTTGGVSDIVGAVAIPAIQGEWVTGCLEQGSLFQQQTLSVVGSRMLSELSNFSDQACTMPVAPNLDINGSTIQRNATTVPTGCTRAVSLGDAIEVNFYYEESTVDNKPLSAIDFPGRDDFIKKIEYSIVLVQNSALYFGNTDLSGHTGQSAENRPISLNTLTVFNRKP